MFWGRVDILASIMLYLTGSKFFTIEKGLFVGRWLNAVSNEYVLHKTMQINHDLFF